MSQSKVTVYVTQWSPLLSVCALVLISRTVFIDRNRRQVSSQKPLSVFEAFSSQAHDNRILPENKRIPQDQTETFLGLFTF